MLNRLNLGLKKSFVLLNNKSIRFLSTTSSDIIVERPSDGIVHLSLNRDKGKNSFSKQFLNDFTDTVAYLHNDESIRVLILKSNINKVFCAGADLKERASMPENQVEGFVATLRNAFTSLENLPFPTIAAIEGAALGGGLELALACDLRIAGSAALLGLPETALGIIPGAGGTQRLPRVIGIPKAKELIFLSKRLTGAEAERIGLVTECVEEGKAVERATELATKIAINGPIAQRMAKRAVTMGMQVDITSGLKIERECYGKVIVTSDRKEGLQAFMEKRIPVYLGK